MNFYPSDVKAFISKLKGLIKKISKSSNNEIESHLLACHQLVVQIIKEDEALKSFNGQKIRLLAYEAVLYVFDLLSMRSESLKSSEKSDEKSKITTYLGDINSTLIEVKELLRRCERESTNNGRKSFLPGDETFSKLDKNLNQYSSKLGLIMTELEREKNQKLESLTSLTSLSNLKEAEKEDESDSIIEEMQRIIEKKEKKILELTNLLKQFEKEKLEIEIKFENYQNQFNLKHDDLERQLLEITTKNKELELELEHKVQMSLKDTKREHKKRLKIEKETHKIDIFNDEKKTSSRNVIENITEETIPSIFILNQKENSEKKGSMEKVNSVKSFVRYRNSEEKDSLLNTFTNDKKMKELTDRNDELYMLLLIQAATIEEIM